MGLWGRPRPGASLAASTDAPSWSEAPADREGDSVCTEPACSLPTGVGCEYVDRRGRACPTSWCPEHRLIVEGHLYCRRHAGLVSALPGGHVSNAAPMPDLENRAPSLVSWVAREVDPEIRRFMVSELLEASDARLLTDPVYLVFTGSDRRRAWERAWKLVDHDGHALRVSLLVEESADAEVAVKVDAEIVQRVVPPWIVQRVHGVATSPEMDAQRRRDFNRRILTAIRRGVEHGRGHRDPGAGGPAGGHQPHDV